MSVRIPRGVVDQAAFASASVAERRDAVARAMGVDPALVGYGLDEGGLDIATANAFIENAVGTRTFAYAVLPCVRVNEQDFIVPLIADEPGLVSSLTAAATMLNGVGGIHAQATGSSTMVAQVQLTHVHDRDEAARKIVDARDELLSFANEAVPSLAARGGGAREIVVRQIGTPADQMLVVHVSVDCADAMGANLVNTVAEAVAPRLAQLATARMGLRILSNLCDDRRVVATCEIPSKVVVDLGLDPGRLAQVAKLVRLDSDVAVAHNKAVMDAIDGIVIATGNDWRAVEAGAHAFAARDGVYRSLAHWRHLEPSFSGCLDVPLALGTVGGTLRMHRAAQLSLRILGVERAADLALITASIGLLASCSFVLTHAHGECGAMKIE